MAPPRGSRPRPPAAARTRPGAAQAAGAKPALRPGRDARSGASAAPPWSPPPWAGALALPLALLVTLVVHASALGTFFAQDDITFLSRARSLKPTAWSLARPLSEIVTWRALNALFGLRPLPYHLCNLALHLANVALVYAIARRLAGGRGAAFSAAVLFGASAIAFTPLHWATGLVELTTATCALGAFLLYLRARDTGSGALLWLSALAALAAMLCKESAIVYPLVLIVAERRAGFARPEARGLIPGAAVAALFGAAFLATLERVRYIGTEAYSMTASPAFLAGNLATYLRWLVALGDPIRDAAAFAHPEALATGALVALAIVAALWFARRAERHPEEIGAAWFLAFLLPVLPLRVHTYLYYLYLPWAGACWLIAGALARPARRAGWIGAVLAALTLLAFAGIERRNVGTREHAMIGDFAADRTMRESGMLRNVVGALDSARLAPGTAFALVSPAEQRHFALVEGASAEHSYIPLEGAMRGGETPRLFHPELHYLGIGHAIPPEWENAEVFLYHSDGTLRPLGRRGHAQSEIGYFLLRLRQFEKADSLFHRALALGDTVPDAVFGLVITRDALKHPDQSRAWAAEFLRRWPREPRAAAVSGVLGGGAGAPSPSR